MYAYAKAVNKGYIDARYRTIAEKAFNGLKKTLLRENPDGTLTLTRCCQVGGLGGTPYRDGALNITLAKRCVTTMPKLPVLSSWVACNLANRIISHKQQNYPSF